jgi:hypothetical protein
MPKVIDLTGQSFGRLVVVRQAPKRIKASGSTVTLWVCICECGRETTVDSYVLRSGRTASCGCLRTELLKARVTTHGMSKTPEYASFMAAKDRTKPNHRQARDYYDLGRKFLFSSFEEFIAEVGTMEEARQRLGLPPGTPLFLERIDNDGNYESGNVKWATRREQNLNKRTVRKLQTEKDRLGEVLKRHDNVLIDLLFAEAVSRAKLKALEAVPSAPGSP